MPLVGPEGREQLKDAARVGSVGLELVLAIVVGLLGGQWLDSKFGSEPWLQWFGFLVGLAAGARRLYQVARSGEQAPPGPDGDELKNHSQDDLNAHER